MKRQAHAAIVLLRPVAFLFFILTASQVSIADRHDVLSGTGTEWFFAAVPPTCPLSPVYPGEVVGEVTVALGEATQDASILSWTFVSPGIPQACVVADGCFVDGILAADWTSIDCGVWSGEARLQPTDGGYRFEAYVAGATEISESLTARLS